MSPKIFQIVNTNSSHTVVEGVGTATLKWILHRIFVTVGAGRNGLEYRTEENLVLAVLDFDLG
jgi:hypothetical protein